MYRVRKTWEDEASQLDAFEIYALAVNKVNQNPGYAVFDDDGHQLYPPSAPTLTLDEDDEFGNGQALESKGPKEYLDTVRTMSYKAKLKRKIGSHAKGSKVTVTINRKKKWVMTDGTVVADRKYLDLTKQIYKSSASYSKEVAEAWVNSEGFSSSTSWLFWANKYCQRVFIFKGSKGHWVLQKTYKCGTGKISDGDGGDPGVYFSAKIWDKKKQYQGPRGIQYWNMHYSSKYGNSIHRGSTGKPSTHGCIALNNKNVQWVYNNLPLNTKVILY